MPALITNPRELQYSSVDHTRIDMIVTHSQLGDIPFTAAQDDTEEHSRYLFQKAIEGSFGSILAYDPSKYDPFYIPEITAVEI